MPQQKQGKKKGQAAEDEPEESMETLVAKRLEKAEAMRAEGKEPVCLFFQNSKHLIFELLPRRVQRAYCNIRAKYGFDG